MKFSDEYYKQKQADADCDFVQEYATSEGYEMYENEAAVIGALIRECKKDDFRLSEILNLIEEYNECEHWTNGYC